jgi:hypothetical protein
MPTINNYTYPDFSGTSKKAGCFTDTNGNNYPIVRFQDEEIQLATTVPAATYANGAIIGASASGKLTFASASADSGWGGAITGAALNINNTTLATDTLTLLLFAADLTTTITNNTLLSALTLTDAEADSYVGAIAFANPVQISGRTLFSSTALNLKYVCVATSLFGIVTLTSTASRTLTASRMSIGLQINKS